jgi:hypothetical protein
MDDVLAEPHTASSGPIFLAAGARVEFEWTWFNRGGPGLGKTYYSRNGGSIALLGNSAQGLTPDTPSYAVRTYKSDGLPGTEINNFADADLIRGNPRYPIGSSLRNVFNMIQTGAGGDFANDEATPGLPGPSAADDFVVEGAGMLVMTPAQAVRYIFRSNTDDGARLRLFDERIDWKVRYFIPWGEKAKGVLEAVVKDRPIIELRKLVRE